MASGNANASFASALSAAQTSKASASAASSGCSSNNLAPQLEALMHTVRLLRLGSKHVSVCREMTEKLVRALGVSVSGTRIIVQDASSFTQHDLLSSPSAFGTGGVTSLSSPFAVVITGNNNSNTRDKENGSAGLLSPSEIRHLRKHFHTNTVGGHGAVLNALQSNGTDVSVAELSLALMTSLLCHHHPHHHQQMPAATFSSLLSQTPEAAAHAAAEAASPLLAKIKGRSRAALRKLVKKWTKKNATRLAFAALVKHFDSALPAAYLRGIVLPVCRLAHALSLGDAKLTATARVSGALHVLTRVVLSYPAVPTVTLEVLSTVLATLVSLCSVKLSLSALARNGFGVAPILSLIKSLLFQTSSSSSASTSSSSSSNSSHAVHVAVQTLAVARWCFRLIFYNCIVDPVPSIKAALENNIIDVCIAVLEKCSGGPGIVSTSLHCNILDLMTLLLYGTPSPSPAAATAVSNATVSLLLASPAPSPTIAAYTAYPASTTQSPSHTAEAHARKRRAIVSHSTEKHIVHLIVRAASSPAIQDPREIIDLYNNLVKFLGMTELPVGLDGELVWHPTNGCPAALLKNEGAGESSDDDDEAEKGDDEAALLRQQMTAEEQQRVRDAEERMEKRVALLFPETAEAPQLLPSLASSSASLRVPRETAIDFDEAATKVRRVHYANNITDPAMADVFFPIVPKAWSAPSSSSASPSSPPQPPSWSVISSRNAQPVEIVPLDPLPNKEFLHLARAQFARLIDPAAPVAQIIYDNVQRSTVMPRAYAVPPHGGNGPSSPFTTTPACFSPTPPHHVSAAGTTSSSSSPTTAKYTTTSGKQQHQQSSSSPSSKSLNAAVSSQASSAVVFTTPQLIFDANFECGNLKRAIRIGDTDYDVICSGDTNTQRQGQWFYFSVRGMVAGVGYTFRFINFDRAASSFGCGNRPVMYSERLQSECGSGWMRAGENVAYFRNTFVKPSTVLESGLSPSTPATTTASGRKKRSSSSSSAANNNNNNSTNTACEAGNDDDSLSSAAAAAAGKRRNFRGGGTDSSIATPRDGAGATMAASTRSESSAASSSSAAAAAAAGAGGGGASGRGGGGGGTQKREVMIQTLLSNKQQTLNTLHFTLRFPYSDDRVFLCPYYPFSYTDVIKHIKSLQAPDKYNNYSNSGTSNNNNNNNSNNLNDCCADMISPCLMIQTLCESDAGLPVPILTITNLFHEDLNRTPVSPQEMAQRPVCVISARVHPGEVVSSFVVRGLIDFLLDPVNPVSRALRQSTVWKIIPVLNPDGVVHGHYRCDLHGYDLNRMFLNPLAVRTPAIAHLNQLFKQLRAQGRRVVFYGDLHGHSKRTGCFTYGCGSARRAVHGAIVESVFPAVLHSLLPGFDPEGCTYRVLPSKIATGRVVAYRAHDIRMSYTLEVSLLGGWRFCPVSTGEDEELIERDAVRAMAAPELVLNTPQSLQAIGAMFAKAFYCVAENFLTAKADDLFRIDCSGSNAGGGGEDKNSLTIADLSNNSLLISSSSSPSSSSAPPPASAEVQVMPRRGLLAETAVTLLIAKSIQEKARQLMKKASPGSNSNNAAVSTGGGSATASAASASGSASAASSTKPKHSQSQQPPQQQQQQQQRSASGENIIGPSVPQQQAQEALAALFPRFMQRDLQAGTAVPPMSSSSSSPPPAFGSFSGNANNYTVPPLSSPFFLMGGEFGGGTPTITTTTTSSSSSVPSTPATGGGGGRKKKNLLPAAATAGGRRVQQENETHVAVAWGGKAKETTVMTIVAGGGNSSSHMIYSTNILTPIWEASISPGGLIVTKANSSAAKRASYASYGAAIKKDGEEEDEEDDDDLALSESGSSSSSSLSDDESAEAAAAAGAVVGGSEGESPVLLVAEKERRTSTSQLMFGIESSRKQQLGGRDDDDDDDDGGEWERSPRQQRGAKSGNVSSSNNNMPPPPAPPRRQQHPSSRRASLNNTNPSSSASNSGRNSSSSTTASVGDTAGAAAVSASSSSSSRRNIANIRTSNPSTTYTGNLVQNRQSHNRND